MYRNKMPVMKSTYGFFLFIIVCLLIAACNNSSSPNSSLTSKDTTELTTDHTKNGNDTSTMDNVKPKVPVGDSLHR